MKKSSIERLRNFRQLFCLIVVMLFAFMSANVASATTYDNINDLTTLKGFIQQNPVSETTGTLGSSFSTEGNIGDVTANGLTLNGNSKELDGGSAYSGFEIGNAITSFVLNNATMKNFKTDSSGGAVYNAGTLNLTGINLFKNNKANGSANDIYNTGTLNITGGTTTLNSGLVQSGANAVTNVLSGATLNLNGANTLDGSILVEGILNATNLTVNSTVNSTSGLDVISVEGGQANLTGNTNITYSKIGGGWATGIYSIDDAIVTLQDAKWQKSNVNISVYSKDYTSEGISARSGSIKFTNSGNTTITAWSDDYGANAVVSFDTLNFTPDQDGANVLVNSYVKNGNAIANVVGLLVPEGGELNVSNKVDTFKIQTAGTGNMAPSSGTSDGAAGIVINLGGQIEINSDKFIVNSKGGEEVSLYALDGTTKIADVAYNAPETPGVNNTIAGIRVHDDSDSTVNKVSKISVGKDTTTEISTSGKSLRTIGIFNGAAQEFDKGGTVEILGDTTVTSTGGADTYSVYTADGGKTVLGSTGKTVSLTGDVKVANGGELQINGSTNSIIGRAIIEGSTSKAIFNNLTITGQSYTSNGGAIWNEGTIDNIGTTNNKATFADNKAKCGGAIYNKGYPGTAIITAINADFTGNTATSEMYGGGAIYNYANSAGQATIGSITGQFKENHAAFGGAIDNHMLNGTGKAEITLIDNSTFENNYATANGGAISNIQFHGESGGTATMAIDNSTFTTNHAAKGGAVYNSQNNGTATLTLDNSKFNGNYATAQGGAIWNAAAMTIEDTDFIGNYADGATALGGAIYNEAGATLTLKNTDFYGNYVTSDGNNSVSANNVVANVMYTNMTSGVVNEKFRVLQTNIPSLTSNSIATSTTGYTLNDIYNAGTLNILGDVFMSGGVLGSGTTFIGDGSTETILTLGNGAKFEQNNITFNKATIDMQNGSIDEIKVTDTVTGVTVSGANEFKLDYDPIAVSIDKVTNSKATGSASDSIKVTSINLLNEAIDTSQKTVRWFNAVGDFADSTVTIGTVTSKYVYEFNADGANGDIDVIIHDAITLPKAVNDANYNYITLYTMGKDETLTEALGTLASHGTPEDRKFTILGNGYTIDATNATGDNTGIIIQSGQTFAIDNANMKNFKNTSSFGGAIASYGTVTDITGKFDGNSAVSNTDQMTFGGAIYNEGTITNLNADFDSNYVKSTGSGKAYGGAIYNEGIIGDITDPSKPTGGIGSATQKATFTGNGIKDGVVVTQKGGAIYNEGTITNIYGDFYGNSATFGGAIISNLDGDSTGKTTATISKISGNFTNNSAEDSGGAIYNGGNASGKTATITSIIDTAFTGNKATSKGGAIYNSSGNYGGDGIITAITNTSFTNNSAQQGGAIYNHKGTITKIIADFTGNSATQYGGAIYNTGIITNLVADFTNNSASIGGAICVGGGTVTINNSTFKQNEAEQYGGAIDVRSGGTLNVNNSNFDGNIAKSSNGGAINSDGAIVIKNSTFTNNVSDGGSGGGAIMAFAGSATIENSTFTNNKTSQNGGAIYNKTTITNLIADFIDNYVKSTSGDAKGGAIYNDNGKITTLTGTFDSNYTESTSGEAQGGAIYNSGAGASLTIKNSKFTNNYAQGATALGGAIYNIGQGLTVQDTKFDGNYVVNNGVKTYNDIYNLGGLTLLGDVSMTGGILNDGTNGTTVIGDGSTTTTLKLGKDATLLQNTLTVKNATLDFLNSSVSKTTGTDQYKVTNFSTDVNGAKFKVDVANVYGTPTMDKLVFTSSTGATVQLDEINIVNDFDTVAHSVMTFLDSTKTGTERDAEFAKITDNTNTIKTATEGHYYEFSGNNASSGSAAKGTVKISKCEENSEITLSNVITNKNNTWNDGKENIQTFSLTKDSTLTGDLGTLQYKGTGNRTLTIYGNGHTIDGTTNEGVNVASGQTLNIQDTTMTNFKKTGGSNYGSVIKNEGTSNISNVVFNNNEASDNGGVISNESGSVLTITNSIFKDNQSGGNGGAIWNESTLNLIGENKFENNTINGNSNDIYNIGTLKIAGTTTMTGGINGNGTTTIGNGSTPTTVTLGNDATLQQNEVILNHNATLALGKKASDNFGVDTFTVNGCALSLQNSTINNFAFNNLVLNDPLDMMVDANLAAGTMDTISITGTLDGTNKVINVSNIRLLSDAIKDETQIQFADSTLKGIVNYTGEQGISYSPLYKYNVAYNKLTGKFAFNRFGGGNNPTYDDLNPALFASAVGAQIGGYLTQLNSYEQAFTNMDMYMLMTKEQRQAMKFANKYASTVSKTDVVYDPTYDQYYNNAAWFRPYVTFESVPLHNGPKVNNTAYGAFFGGDSGLKELGHGWDGLWGAYVGYNGSTQSYDGNKIYQNGGTLGLNGTLYKGNFFLGGTVNVGASGAEQNTMFGKDNFALLSAGVAAKTGYNWELFNGRFIIQPSFMMSYSFINTFDYTNGAGVKISTDPLNAIQLAPEIKFIGNLPHGWQPYASVQMVWNLLDESRVNASFAGQNVDLPGVSINPYVRYGVGVQKSWGERFTGFFQTYVTNGGRNGVGLQAGFRWTLGKK